MLHKLLLVVCIKVSRHGLRQHRPHLLRVDLGSTLQLEPLISFHIGGFTLKPVRFILRQPDHGAALAALTD